MTDQQRLATNLPLFPLNVVLFPGNILPLHIFEERYRTMIHECLQEDSEFGIILAKGGRVIGDSYSIGTAVKIIDSDIMEDGRMNIMTVGQYRFEVQEITCQTPYLEALVDPISTNLPIDPTRLQALISRASELCETYENLLAETVTDWEVPKSLPERPFHLACHIATRLQITLIEKQRLLEIFSVDQMLIKEIKILQYEIQRRKATVIAERQFKSIPESEIPFWKKHSLN
ncbi:MAG: LON peptidase substrate-binding domain-containing protein [Candidatus Poribacteria bacterium]|nr:LON peptidase substrate-binding domain-containing protein [Candidatus Poribacteria bacterium]